MSNISPVLAFALTALVIEITPGPNMTYLAVLSLSGGARTGFAAVAGIALGLLIYGIIAALGVAALIDNSPLLYGLLRWGGVAYFLWLAWESWSDERETSPENIGSKIDSPWPAFRRGLITNLLNPKAAVFYIAVLPDFIQRDGGSVVIQTLLLSAVYVSIATAIHLTIVVLAGTLQTTIGGKYRRTMRRGLALVMVGIAIWFALTTGRSASA